MTARRAWTALAVAALAPATVAAQPGAAEAPVEPAPVEPAPVEPAPETEAPVEPAPVEPAPVEPAPADPAAEAEAPAVDDDALLAELGLDNGGFDDKLHLYGFAEFGLIVPIVDDDALAASTLPKEGSFYGASLNLYATRALSPRWRSMVEVHFTYAPAGQIKDDGTYETAIAEDPANGPVQWGGIAVERAYLEYAYDDHVVVQVGTFLTPYGIWNVDHGAPVIVGGMRPWIIGQELFPEHQTGVHVHGKHAFGAYTLGYHGTLSNGRGPLSSFHDLDRNKAIGGRLQLDTPWLGGVTLGVSGYRGRFTERPADVIAPDANGDLITVTPPGTSYWERSLALDARLQRGPLLVQAEAILREAHYVEGGRPAARVGYEPDVQSLGGYILGAYRIDALGGVMPFALAELDLLPATPGLGDDARMLMVAGGLNYRPIPEVVLKAVYGRLRSWDIPIEYDFDLVDFRAAWVF